MVGSIEYITEYTSKDELLSMLDPVIREWFESKFQTLTEPQAYAIKYIHNGKNVLVSAPTGSGKTLTGFLTIINELFLLAKQRELKDQVYCVYISPLKALANDIHRNLDMPLKEIYEIAIQKNYDLPKITVGVRSGDTPSYVRQKMLKKPPHIFITTPESLGLVLSSLKFREKFKNVQYVIVDEIHELAVSKRGIMLSLNLERLAEYAGEFVRIGLSATQAPIKEMAKFLAGYKDKTLRKIYITETEPKKKIDLKVITPVSNLLTTPYEIVNEKMYTILEHIINTHKTTLIFTNTRSGSEHVALKLKQRGIKYLAVHHSSLGKFTRMNVEEKLKRGQLKCVISSTSLELGIDIGYIDVVVQIGSPKSITKGLQRIGRSGHVYGAIAKGIFIALNNDDLLECAVLVKNAYENKLDRVQIPKKSLDVLAQVVAGMSLEKIWAIDEAYKLVKRSYCYKDLTKTEFMEVINYLSGKTYGEPFYSKIWYDPDTQKFGKKKSTRIIYFMNLGTIPEEADFRIVDEKNLTVGMLSEKFVERLRPGDIFVLGAKSYEFLKLRVNKVYVRSVVGKKPTVPSWVGEMLPRSFDLSLEVARFRGELEQRIRAGKEVISYLINVTHVDENGAKSIITYIKEQMTDIVPTNKQLLIEGYIDPSKKANIIFHYPFGKRVNDALSRAYAYVLSNRYNTNVRLSVTDDAFMITLTEFVPLQQITELLKTDMLETYLKKALHNTELYKQRFRHCATRAFMVLRRYKNADISVTRQQLRSERILNILEELKGFPIIKETYNEIFNIVMDLPHAKLVLKNIEQHKIKVVIKEYSEQPSIFAHSIILAGVSDIVLMEDRTALLKEIHMKVLERIIPKEELYLALEPTVVRNFYNTKFPDIETAEDIISFLKKVGTADLFTQKGVNIYMYSKLSYEHLKALATKLLKEGKVTTIYTTQRTWTLPEYLAYYMTIYQKDLDSKDAQIVLNAMHNKSAIEGIKQTGIKKDKFFELLKQLEQYNLIYRKDIIEEKPVWDIRKKYKINYNDALQFVILKTLEAVGPITRNELLYRLGVKESDINQALKALVDNNTVLYGKFLPEYEPQYILADDYNSMKLYKHLDIHTIKKYRFFKLLKRVNSILEYFDKYLFSFTSYAIFLRVANFDSWRELRKEGKVLYGRFVKNRFCFASKHSAQIFYIMPKALNKFEQTLISIINFLDNPTFQNILQATNENRQILRKELSFLESALKIGIKYTDDEESKTNHPYQVLNLYQYSSKQQLVLKLVEALGPLNLYELLSITTLEKYELSNILNNLELNQINIDGLVYYYAPTEQIIDFHKDRIYALLDFNDPYLLPYHPEIYARYKANYNYYLVDSGEIVGALKIEHRDAYLDITNIEVSGTDEFKHAMTAVLNLLKFKEYDTLKVSNVSTPSFENILQVLGFTKIGTSYFYGTIHPENYSKEELLKYVLSKQGLGPQKKESVSELEHINLGIRTDFESISRVKNLAVAEKFFKNQYLYLGYILPNMTGFCSKDTLVLLKNAKNKKLTKEHTVVLNIIKRNPYFSEEYVLEESPLGIEITKNLIKELLEANYIAKTYSGAYIIADAYIDQYFAQYLLLKRLFESFGALNIKRILNIVGDIIERTDILKLLRKLEQEQFIKKVFFEDVLYWVVANDLPQIRKFSISDAFILAPQDILAFYLHDEIKAKNLKRAYLIFRGTKIQGYFKGSKRQYELKVREFKADLNFKNFIRKVSNKIGLKLTYPSY